MKKPTITKTANVALTSEEYHEFWSFFDSDNNGHLYTSVDQLGSLEADADDDDKWKPLFKKLLRVLKKAKFLDGDVCLYQEQE